MSVVALSPQIMSLRQVAKSWANILSLTAFRRTSLPIVGHRYQNHTSYTSKRLNSNAPKNPNSNEPSITSTLPPKSAMKAKEKASPAEPKPTVAEKGDTYKSGEGYYSFNPFSFYDIENQMSSHRLPQPSSSEKAQ